MEVEEHILETSHTVAVVGLSPREGSDSLKVGRYLAKHGYRVIPVNPTVTEVMGEKSYPDLSSIPEPVDVVDIFRRPEAVPPIVEEAVKIGAKAVWLQLGIVNEEAARRAREAGLLVVMDKCMRREHLKMTGHPETD